MSQKPQFLYNCRVLNTVVELIRLEDKLELLHMNFISLQICFVAYDKTSLATLIIGVSMSVARLVLSYETHL
jgi:hypothetical protein